MERIFLFILIVQLTNFGILKNNKTQNVLEIGWYYETENNANSKSVKDYSTNQIYFVEKKPIITSKDIKKLEIVERQYGNQNQLYLDIILKDKAVEKWADATDRLWKNDEFAVFIYNDKVVCRMTTFRRIDNGYASIVNKDLTKEKLTEILNAIQDKR